MPLFVEEFQKRLPKGMGVLSHAKILDAGCGNCRNTVWLSRRLPRAYIHCCDISEGMLHSASKNVAGACKAHSCTIRRADITNLHYPTALFDAVLCTAVLHHIPDKKGWVRALSEIRRVLKPAGFAFITVWNKQNTKPGTDRDVDFPTKKGNNVPRFYHFFTKHELDAAAKASGLVVIDTFLEAGGKRTVKGNKKARNLCFVLQKQQRQRK